MKVIGAIAGTPPMSKEEIDAFLQKNLILQIGTIDEKGDPNILPIWFNYDRSREKLLILTPENIQKDSQYAQKGSLYFSIDEQNFPFREVKGKGLATIIEDPFRTLVEAKKIYIKYLGTLDHPIPKMILDSVKKGNHAIIEIDPKFFSTWGFWQDLRIQHLFL